MHFIIKQKQKKNDNKTKGVCLNFMINKDVFCTINMYKINKIKLNQ